MAQQHYCVVSSIRPPGHRPKFGIEVLLLAFLTLDFLRPLFITAQEAPGDTPYYYLGCYTARVDLTQEQLFSKGPQVCVEFCEVKDYSFAALSSDKCYCTHTIVAEDKQDDQLCSTRCLASKSEYCGGVGVHSYYSTEVARSAAAKELKVVNASQNSLTISWLGHNIMKHFIAGVESMPMIRVTNYMIKTERLHTYSTQPFYQPPEFIVQGNETKFEITDLHPATEYKITVQSLCESNTQGASKCGLASVEGTTVVGDPSPPPPAPKVLASSDKTITIQIRPIRNNNGPVTKVLIIVERVDDSITQPFDSELLGSWRQAEESGLPYYIAAELDYDRPGDNKTRKFVVGDGKRYGRYTNPPLDNKNSDLHISLGVVSTLNNITKTLYTRSTHEQHVSSMDNFTYSTFESGSNSVVALIVTCSIFGVCFILSVITYFYLRYKTCQMQAGRGGNSHEMTMQQPIIDRENNGFVMEDEPPHNVESFKEQLNSLVDRLETSKRIPRNNLRLNVNDVIAMGNYGDVITGKLMQNSLPESTAECQLHVLSLDELTSTDQGKLLQEFRNLIKLQQHPNILDFFGVSASTDWFYFVFEHQTVTLKRRLIESRRAPSSAPVQRITSLSEQMVLQWIYEIASALEYLAKSKVVHKHLSSHCIYVTAEMKLKVSVFGPTPYIQNQKKVDLTRWLAPEALRYQHYSSKSDVWSFAVVAWECCSLGATPYSQINNSNKVLDALKSGSRPAQPSFVFQDLYQMLLNCWTLEPSERTSFEDITFNVRQMMTSPRHSLCFDVQPSKPGANEAVLDALPFYMPALEMEN
ncbi:putative inactive tyrosine-protein kinase Wsck [Stomoxys calcitrans]|uniref:Protein kinase domain-containing protein n=1 Tax=Stomoxys calcitrans TaxID=35570 RepID=A0A1I8PBC7_STOCA|nr:putative inactive tyrosine-protein kinase Wsck [Stomoxys calcitrans]